MLKMGFFFFFFFFFILRERERERERENPRRGGGRGRGGERQGLSSPIMGLELMNPEIMTWATQVPNLQWVLKED